jgi:uncharacterized membrane protein YkvA (DUF1232 family)
MDYSKAGNERRLGLITELYENARLVWRLLFDSRVSFISKMLLPGAFAYFASPIDAIPDVFVTFFGVGYLDDLAVIVIAVRLFIAMAPKAVVAEHLEAIRGNKREPRSGDTVVDSSFRVVHDN